MVVGKSIVRNKQRRGRERVRDQIKRVVHGRGPDMAWVGNDHWK
jgi:hypothetical protein